MAGRLFWVLGKVTGVTYLGILTLVISSWSQVGYEKLVYNMIIHY